jgi:hypothetical protein
LALQGEVQGLPVEGFARGFAAELGVFQLLALERAVEAQLALQFAACAHDRLVGASEKERSFRINRCNQIFALSPAFGSSPTKSNA